MFLMMIPICSTSLMKLGEFWKKCWNFMIFQRAGTVGIFPWNKLTSLNGPKFHMHVSDDDSNMFCKFDEIWWTLKKCWNFMIFWRAGSVSIFLWKNLTSLNRLKFHMHVSDDDSNMFCKFDESWWTLKKCWNFMIFLGPARQHFSEWAGISHACFWWWNLESLMKAGELWKNNEILWYF